MRHCFIPRDEHFENKLNMEVSNIVSNKCIFEFIRLIILYHVASWEILDSGVVVLISFFIKTFLVNTTVVCMSLHELYFIFEVTHGKQITICAREPVRDTIVCCDYVSRVLHTVVAPI